MRLTNSNKYTEKWYKVFQNATETLTLRNDTKTLITQDHLNNDDFDNICKIRFINSIVETVKGDSVGQGLMTCQLNMWHQIANVGFIKFYFENTNLYVEYKGNYNIQVGEFEIGHSTLKTTIFKTPIDFTPPVTIPPVSKINVSISDGVIHPMGVFFSVLKGKGRLKEVICDIIKDSRKNLTITSPLIYHRSTTTTTNQGIMYNNTVYNNSIYTTSAGIGTINTSLGTTEVKFRIVLNIDDWEIFLQLSNVGSGQIGRIDNKIPTSLLPATESLIFSAMTY